VERKGGGLVLVLVLGDPTIPISSPNISTQGSELQAVTALAHNKLRAVGDLSTSNTVNGPVL